MIFCPNCLHPGYATRSGIADVDYFPTSILKRLDVIRAYRPYFCPVCETPVVYFRSDPQVQLSEIPKDPAETAKLLKKMIESSKEYVFYDLNRRSPVDEVVKALIEIKIDAYSNVPSSSSAREEEKSRWSTEREHYFSFCSSCYSPARIEVDFFKEYDFLGNIKKTKLLDVKLNCPKCNGEIVSIEVSPEEYARTERIFCNLNELLKRDLLKLIISPSKDGYIIITLPFEGAKIDPKKLAEASERYLSPDFSKNYVIPIS